MGTHGYDRFGILSKDSLRPWPRSRCARRLSRTTKHILPFVEARSGVCRSRESFVMFPTYVIEVGGQQAGIVVLGRGGFRFYAASKQVRRLEGEIYPTAAAATDAVTRLLKRPDIPSLVRSRDGEGERTDPGKFSAGSSHREDFGNRHLPVPSTLTTMSRARLA
jgi:hypothetical protein